LPGSLSGGEEYYGPFVPWNESYVSTLHLSQHYLRRLSIRRIDHPFLRIFNEIQRVYPRTTNNWQSQQSKYLSSKSTFSSLIVINSSQKVYPIETPANSLHRNTTRCKPTARAKIRSDAPHRWF